MSGEQTYYAKDGKVWKHPVETKTKGGKSVTVGFPVCTMTAVVGEEAAARIDCTLGIGEASAAIANEYKGDKP